ncbi:MAG: macro domain-containing protein [Thermodesulfobacteriota bacterium]
MTIRYKKEGSIVEEQADVLVNTVNCVGVMGKGVAKEFKRKFNKNFEEYEAACKKKEVKPGEMFLYKVCDKGNGMSDMFSLPKYIVNFPTKQHWRAKSRMEYIEDGLKDLVKKIQRRKSYIQSIAIPPLGCGAGGLDWSIVRPLIERAFEDMNNLEIIIFEPKELSDETDYLNDNM